MQHGGLSQIGGPHVGSERWQQRGRRPCTLSTIAPAIATRNNTINFKNILNKVFIITKLDFKIKAR